MYMKIAENVYTVKIPYNQIETQTVIQTKQPGTMKVTYITRNSAREALTKLKDATWADDKLGISKAERFEVTYNIGKIREGLQSIPHAKREDLERIMKYSKITKEQQETCTNWLHQGHDLIISRAMAKMEIEWKDCRETMKETAASQRPPAESRSWGSLVVPNSNSVFQRGRPS